MGELIYSQCTRGCLYSVKNSLMHIHYVCMCVCVGLWRVQVEHVVTHLKAHSQTSTEFQSAIGSPQLGKVSNIHKVAWTRCLHGGGMDGWMDLTDMADIIVKKSN